MKPTIKPARPRFSSGPCAKRPGWKPEILATEALGRSHRSDVGKRKLAEAIDRSREILGIPDDYRLGIVPGSDTGAMEMAMWSLLGPRGVDILVWESFSAGWATDIVDHLGMEDVRVIKAPYGELPDLDTVDCDRDVVFVWNGTTSGVRVPDRDWIDPAREGLTICDATSAAFAMDLPWGRLDVVTWSWQKCLGGEGGHGMIALSPRAVARLETHTPDWPLPKVFRMTKKGALIEGIFTGSTINTPSMLCVEDWLDALRWAESIGGLPELVARAEKNLGVITDWVDDSEDFAFLAEDPTTRSCTSVCLKITAPWFIALDPEQQRAAVKRMTALLAEEEVAFDIAGYRDAPPGLRVWAGPTIETEDLVRLLPWLDWALQQIND